jgi:hypothetical protein
MEPSYYAEVPKSIAEKIVVGRSEFAGNLRRK